MHRLSFIRHIAATSENSVQWHTLTLAYRALALIDLIAVNVGDPDSSAVSALLSDARSLREDDPIVDRIVIIASRLSARRRGYDPELATAVLDLSELLQRSCLSALALDVALAALRLAAQDESVAWRAHRLCGWAYRSLGQLDEAATHYAACIEIGQRSGSVESVFWGRNGEALLVQHRGNLPRAEALLRHLVVWARRKVRPDLEAYARHGLGIILGLRCALRESLHQLNTALQTAPPTEFGRILLNIGYTHLRLGELALARDVFLGLIATVNDPYETYISHINLIDVYAAFGQRVHVETLRRYLESQPLLPDMIVDFQLTLGRAYSTLGDPANARPCFERAEALAHRIGMGRAIIEADNALSRESPSAPGGHQKSLITILDYRGAAPSLPRFRSRVPL